MKVVIRGLGRVRKQPERVIEGVRRGLLGVATKVYERLVENTPADTGRLRGGYRIQPLTLGYRITNINKYGAYVNWGTRPFYPPIRAIKGWARRRGLNPYAVQRSIGRKGIKPRKFLEKTVKEVQPKIEDWFVEYFKL